MAALTLTGRGGRLGVAAALCAASLAAAGPTSASPGDATPQPRIIGGGAADPATFPFAAAILAKGRFICSGSVVSPRHVVTAAHCSIPKLAELQVVTGRYDLRDTSKGQASAVAAKFVHPDYRRTARHDIAVFGLATATPSPVIQVATPAEGAAAVAPGNSLSVAGWGATTPFQTKLPGFLKTTSVASITGKLCAKRYGKIFRGTSMVCAQGTKLNPGRKTSLRTSPCAGDSGGPLVGSSRLLGVVSFGPRLCGLPFAPVVYGKTFDASAVEFIGAAVSTPLP